MNVRIYGDFNCPFSRLASARAARLEAAGAATIDWRAVEHDPAIPRDGQPVVDELAVELARELDQIRSLLLPQEEVALRLPGVRPSTAAATAAYAAVAPERRPAVREALFAALWWDGRNIGDGAVLTDLALIAQDPELAASWRGEWLALERPIVPVMVLPDGKVSRGLGALKRLADMVTAGAP